MTSIPTQMKAKRGAYKIVGRWVCLLLTTVSRLALGKENPSPLPATNAPSSSTNSGVAKIVFAKRDYDFGKVMAGTVITQSFKFTNEGTVPLVIAKVQPTCGCTTSTNWSKVIEPGKTGVIPIEFYTVHFDGPVTKSLIVCCNDSNQPEVTLQLHGSVWRPLKLVPESAAFTGQYDLTTNNTRIVRILNNLDQPITLGIPECNRKEFKTQIRTNQFGKEYELVVTLVPPLGTGHVFGNVTLKTSSPDMPVLNIPVWALAQSRK